MILEQYPTLEALPVEQKLELLSELLDRVAAETPPLAPEQIEFLDARVKHNEAHPEAVYTTEQVMERLAALKRHRMARLARE